MVQVVRCKMAFVNAHRQQRNLFGQVTVRGPVNEGHLIAVVQQIGLIVGECWFYEFALINDAVIFHLHISRGLEIGPAFIAFIGAIENATQIFVKFDSSFRCRHPQSSRSALDTVLPLWSLSISCP